MKQKAERWNSILYSILSLLQAIIFVFFTSNKFSIIYYFFVGIIINIIYYNVPIITNFFLEPKGVKSYSNINDAYSFREKFLPFIMSFDELLNNDKLIAKIKLYNDWKYAIENLNEIIVHSKIIKSKSVAYNNNYIYVGELKCVIKYLIRIYDMSNEFKDITTVYNCKLIKKDISDSRKLLSNLCQKYNLKCNNMKGTNKPINELKN